MELIDLEYYNTDIVRDILLKDGHTVSAANTILNPGKFEGEHISTLFFWEKVQNGSEDISVYSGDVQYAFFRLSTSEKEHLSTTHEYFKIFTRDNGFVIGDTETEDTVHGLVDAEIEESE